MLDAAAPPARHAKLASHPAARQRDLTSFMVGTLERCVESGSLRNGDEAAPHPEVLPRGAR